MKDKTDYLYYKIYSDILRQLKDGSLKIGNKIDREVDIARKYGVSRGTVRKALESMTQMDLMFRVKKSGTYVNGIPNIDIPQKIFAVILPFNEILHRELISGVQNTAIAYNCFAMIFDSKGNAASEREILNQLQTMDIDGIALYPCSNEVDNIDLLYRFRQKGTPVVFIDRAVPCFPAPLVCSDSKTGTSAAVQHLIDCGHTKIAFFGVSNLGLAPERERLESYMLTMHKNGLPVRNEYNLKLNSPHRVLYTSPRQQSRLYDAMIEEAIVNMLKLDDRPTAIIFIHDMLAVRFYEFAPKYGYSVPDDFSVVGFDDSIVGRELNPQLTTVRQDFFEIGSSAVELICNSPKHFVKFTQTISTSLITRKSVRNLKS